MKLHSGRAKCYDIGTPACPALAIVGQNRRQGCKHLASTGQRLLQAAYDRDFVLQLDTDLELAERVDAFVSRFGRLQDTLGDKLLPLLLRAMGDRPAATIDNLDRAERLGLISSAESWMIIRNLRNQMVHEYVEDLNLLRDALHSGHDFVQTLMDTAKRMQGEIKKRGWLE